MTPPPTPPSAAPPPSGPSSASTRPPRVALETTLLTHGVPREAALRTSKRLGDAVRESGADPALVGVVGGRPVVGMTDAHLQALLDTPELPKLNTANLGAALHRGRSGATTVSTTMELASKAGVRLFATGALGGVHAPAPSTGQGDPLSRLTHDVSSDLAALTRFAIGVVTSGVKSILDVGATREHLETLGVPVVGFRTDAFPAFYLREDPSGAQVDERFDDEADLGQYLRSELSRSARGVVIANPIPAEHEIDGAQWAAWKGQAEQEALDAGVTGRAVTPFLLGRVHELSGGKTLEANIALAESNARLAGRLAVIVARGGSVRLGPG